MKCTVETKDFFGLMKGLSESVHPDCFLRQTKLTEPDKKILNLVKKKVEKSSVDFCHYLNHCVSSSIKYLSGTTDIHTLPQQMLPLKGQVFVRIFHIS